MFRFFFLLFGSAIVLRLGVLQIVEAQHFKTAAEIQHARSEELIPRRGSVFVQDFGDDTWYPVATTAPAADIEADPER